MYEPLLPAFFDNALLEEPKATCERCAMCPPPGTEAAPAPDIIYFRPDIKCCSFHPRLPNYLVGAVLADADPAMAEGRGRVRARIERRLGVTPCWLAPSRKYRLLFRAARASSFGRSTLLRCPYFEDAGGLCTIWRHRNSDCTTFFCKQSAGADGKAFWSALNEYLGVVERRLATHAAAAVAPDLVEPPGGLDAITLEELEDRPPSDADYAACWGDFRGREAELYLACHEVIAGLSRADFDRLLADDAGELAAIEDALRRAREPILPERLVLNPERPPRPFEDGVLVCTFSRYEPFKLSTSLYEALAAFGPGETVAEVRARLQRDHDVELPDALLLQMYQLRILVEA